MCSGLYRKIQEYYENQEWELTKLAIAFSMRGWYAAVTWHQGKLMLIVRSPKTMEAWRAGKQRVLT